MAGLPKGYKFKNPMTDEHKKNLSKAHLKLHRKRKSLRYRVLGF